MKLNIANPETGCQIAIDVDDHKMLLPFFEKRLGAEVPANTLGEQYNGYVLKITGGNDKQGFPMLQGVMTNQRVRLLFRDGMKCYRPRRTGERLRKSVRGCIVSSELSAMNLVVVKKGVNEIEGLTTEQRPRRLGPKRANKIRKLFNLSKEVDVRKYVPRRKIKDTNKTKAPKIQRLITTARLARKERYLKYKKSVHEKNAAALKEYQDLHREYLRKKQASLHAKNYGSLAKKTPSHHN